MYARIPTITTNVGGFPDLVVEGETGYLARVQDPKDLADKIIQALTHSEQCQAMVEKAHERVREVMNVKHNAQEVLSYYRQVLGQQENVA
ncbi:glycosyltransferase [Pseudobowmanella zhangzhouensis]